MSDSDASRFDDSQAAKKSLVKWQKCEWMGEQAEKVRPRRRSMSRALFGRHSGAVSLSYPFLFDCL